MSKLALGEVFVAVNLAPSTGSYNHRIAVEGPSGFPDPVRMIVLEAKGYEASAHNSSWSDTQYTIGILVDDGGRRAPMVSETFHVSSDDAIDMGVQELSKEVWGVERVITWNLTPPQPRYVAGEHHGFGWGVWDREVEEARPAPGNRYLTANSLGNFTSQGDAEQTAKLLNERAC